MGVIGWIKQRVLQTIRICDVAERRAAISVVAVVAPVASRTEECWATSHGLYWDCMPWLERVMLSGSSLGLGKLAPTSRHALYYLQYKDIVTTIHSQKFKGNFQLYLLEIFNVCIVRLVHNF